MSNGSHPLFDPLADIARAIDDLTSVFAAQIVALDQSVDDVEAKVERVAVGLEKFFARKRIAIDVQGNLKHESENRWPKS